MNIVGWQIVKYAVRRAHLRATKTDNARSATEPNTFLKNKAATVTPLASISSYSYLSVEWEVQTNKWNSCLASSSEVSNVRKHIQNRANTKAKGACYFKSPHGIADVVHHIVHVRPTRVSIQDFEGSGSVLLNHVSGCAFVNIKEQTSLLLVELPAKAFLKLTYGSVTRVFPERTTQPEMTTNSRIMILKIERACWDDAE